MTCSKILANLRAFARGALSDTTNVSCETAVPGASPAFVLTLHQELALDAEAIRHFQWRPKAARLVQIMREGRTNRLTLSEICLAIGADPFDKSDLARTQAMLVAWGRAAAPATRSIGAAA